MLIREIEVLPRRLAHSQLRAFVSTLDPTSLTDDDEKCVGEFRTTFRTIPAFVRMVRNSEPQY